MAIKRIFNICTKIQELEEEGKTPKYANYNDIDDMVDTFYDLLISYQDFSIDNIEYKSKIFNSFVVSEMITDPKIHDVTDLETFQSFLSEADYNVTSNFCKFRISFKILLYLCELYEFDKSVKFICREFSHHIVNCCVYSDSFNINDRLKLINVFSKIYVEIGDISGSSGIQGMYNKFNELKDTKVSDLVGEEGINMMAQLAEQVLTDNGHGEFGAKISAALLNASSEVGVEAFKTMYTELAEESDLVASFSDDLLNKLELGDLPVGKVLNTISERVKENANEFKEYAEKNREENDQ